MNEDPADDPPECNDPNFSLAQISPDMMSIVNIYSKDLVSDIFQRPRDTILTAFPQYCSECFLKLWRQRLLSHDLRAGDTTDYMMDQFAALQSNCSVDMPYTTFSPTRPMPTFTGIKDSTITAPPSTATPNVDECTGRVVEPLTSYWPCDWLSREYNVSTGALVEATQHPFCMFSQSICLPPPCPIVKIHNTNW